jgi:hypothetical protein
MERPEFKLKQASAVLGVTPKDLQNLVQLKVLRPPLRDSFYWFDTRLLLEAKLAFYLKGVPWYVNRTSSAIYGRAFAEPA